MGFQQPTKKFNPQSIDNQNLIDRTPDGIKMACPVRLSLKRNGQSWFTFPVEPLVSVKASRTIARRNIAKSIVRSGGATVAGAGAGGALGASAGLVGSQAAYQPFGTVKELVSQDDYSISIEGILISGADAGSDYDQHLQEVGSQVAALNGMLRRGQSLAIECWLTGHLGIDLFAVESWDFPATQGVENQSFTITGYSDFDFELV